MSEGGKIQIRIGNLPFVPGTHDRGDDEKRSSEEIQRRDHSSLRENGSNTYNRQSRNNSASDLKNSLLALLGDRNGKSTTQPQTNRTDNSQNTNNSSHSTNTTNTANTTSFNSTNRQTGQANSQGSSLNIVNQTLDNLINVAQQHTNFEEFNNQSAQFWNDVGRMSEINIVEKYVNGTLEPQATSRYGEILNSFARQGGELSTFLTTLPPGEREVFQARYLLNQTFGADELFVGRGIAIDKSGQFVVREFLGNNGKQLETPLSTLLGLLGSKSSEGAAAALFAFNKS